jgi:hypothetical protein
MWLHWPQEGIHDHCIQTPEIYMAEVATATATATAIRSNSLAQVSEGSSAHFPS